MSDPCTSLSQTVGPVAREGHLLPGVGGGEQHVQHSQHLHELLLVLCLLVQQLLQTQQLSVHQGRHADGGLIDVQEHLCHRGEDGGEPGVNQVPRVKEKEEYEPTPINHKQSAPKRWSHLLNPKSIKHHTKPSLQYDGLKISGSDTLAHFWLQY